MGVGIIGAGWVAGEHIRAFETNPHTEVVALRSRTASYKTHEVCFAADLSAKEGRPVALPLP